MRAGSGLAWFNNRLLIIQDDANFLAFVDADSAQIDAIALPRGHEQLRQFDDLRGNKKHKFDLEACLGIDQMFIGFGSGSSRRREQIVLFTDGEGARVLHAPSLYEALRARSDFAGSELNIEGAALHGDTVLLCNRGNGQGTAVDGMIQIELSELTAFLDGGRVPRLGAVTQYRLGEISGTRLTFTDVMSHGDALLYVAAAEAAPDTMHDGPVFGSAIGIINEKAARWTQLQTADGASFDGKVEGIVDARAGGKVWCLVDRDDPLRATELCLVRLEGAWR